MMPCPNHQAKEDNTCSAYCTCCLLSPGSWGTTSCSRHATWTSPSRHPRLQLPVPICYCHYTTSARSCPLQPAPACSASRAFRCKEAPKNSSELRSSFPRVLHHAHESHSRYALCAAHALAHLRPVRQVAQFVLDGAPHPVYRGGSEVRTADRVPQRYPPVYFCLTPPTRAIEYENGYDLRQYRILLPAPTWSSWLQRTCPRLHGDIGASVRATNELLNVGAMLGQALIAVNREGPAYG